MTCDFWSRSNRTALWALLWTILLPVAAQAEEETAEKAAPPAAAAEDDIYAVPDGTPEELLAFIEKLINTRPTDLSPEGRQQHLERIVAASLDAAAQILNSKEATDKVAARAAERKLLVLSTAATVGIEGMQEQLDEFKELLRKDKRSLVRAVIVKRELLEQLAQWRQFDDDAKNKYISDFISFLQSIELEANDGRLVRGVAQMIGQHDEKAAEAFVTEAIPVFAASKDSDVAAAAVRLEGILRNMNLVGSKMPIEGRLLGGSPLDWSQYKDKVVLVDFWATWCGPCIAEMPNVVDNYKKYHGKGFEVIGISLDENPQSVQEFVEQRDVPWSILFSHDPNATGWEHPMAVKYGIEAIPAPILVGKDGRVISKQARGEALGKHLQELLGDPLPVADDAEDDEALQTSKKDGEATQE